MDTLKLALLKLSESRAASGQDSTVPPIWSHPLLPEAIAYGSWARNGDLPRHESEVIVDPACGAAVLRGAHVFVPGVVGLLPGAKEGDIVSIYADIEARCKRGWAQRLEAENRYFVGNGVLLMGRKDIFCDNGIGRGIAVQVTDNESGCPSLPANSISPGLAVMQNLPSIVCGRVVNPQPGEIILDMCAAPGNKTTHLSMLMKNQGVVIALDRSATRTSKLRQLCKDMKVKNVTAFVCNSVNAVINSNTQIEGVKYGHQSHNQSGPPFPINTFDRVLLDAPCSALGQRPKLEQIDFKHVTSLPPLQKKLFETAVKLLKPGGTLVYSTCTVVVDENEGIVRWALDHFPCLELVPAEPYLFPSVSNQDVSMILSPFERSCVQKYVPHGNLEENHCERDTIGFFIARFFKRV